MGPESTNNFFDTVTIKLPHKSHNAFRIVETIVVLSLFVFFHLAFCSFPATISSQATSTVTTTATTTATNTATTTTKDKPRDSLLEPLSRDSEGNFFQRPILNPPGWFFRRKERKILKGGSQGGGLPPLVFRRRKEIWSGRGVQGSQAAAMPEGGKKKLPEGLGVGGVPHT